MLHHNTSIINYHVPGLLFYKISCNCPINGMISSNMYWHEVRILILPITFIWNVSLAKKNAVRYGKCPSFLFSFNPTWISLAHLNKSPPSINFHKNPFIMSQVVQSGQMNGQPVTFCNLVNALKNMFTPNCHTATPLFFACRRALYFYLLFILLF